MEALTPVDMYNASKRDSTLLFVVFYRGAWCPFCTGWFKEWLKIENFATQLRCLNAAFLVVSSENQDEVDRLMKKLGMDAFDARAFGIGDPENTLALHLRQEGLLNVAITGEPGPCTIGGCSYPRGMVQPACLALEMRDQHAHVLYSWATVPKMLNLQGATDRPSPLKIWDYVMNAMKPDGKKMKKPKGKTMRYIGVHFGKS